MPDVSVAGPYSASLIGRSCASSSPQETIRDYGDTPPCTRVSSTTTTTTSTGTDITANSTTITRNDQRARGGQRH
eukprot:12938014-Prorocentrum_lima.AAC.1